MSTAPPNADFEAAVRTACDANDYERATTLTVRELGHRINAWLIDRLRDETAGSDAFAVFVEDLWHSWSSFDWRCTARAWAFTLARNAANRGALATRRRGGREVPLSRAPARVVAAVDQVRTETPSYRRTEVKDKFRQLRRELSEEDQTILVLRVDQGLSWNEIAHVFLGESDGSEPEAVAVRREAARLRKRLQLIKDQVRKLAARAGLV